MARPKVLALIMAGGEGNRMELLTKQRAKPALPFAGVYRLIDFPMSNCMHSGISDVWIIEQFQPQPINDHLANGRPWDLDRTYGGLRIIQPFTGTKESGWHQGNADAIYRNQGMIAAFNPDLILVLSADHVYKLDYGEVIDQHLGSRADVTIVTTQVPLEEASRFGTVQLEGNKVVDFEYKPETPQSGIVTTEVFVYNTQVLLETLSELASENDEAALKDFGHELLPHLVKQGRVFAYALEGYWKDVGVVADYWAAHMDLLQLEPAINLDDQDWPVLTYGTQRMPAHVHPDAQIDNSLISPGAHIHGTVIRSVLGPGVVVKQGATVRDSIIFRDTIIGPDAQVSFAILDQDVIVEQGAHIGVDGDRSTITLIEASTTIAEDARVKAGARIEAEDHQP